MALRIRLAESTEDLDALFRLRHRVYAKEKHWLPPIPDGRVIDRFDAFPDTANLIAVVDGQVVGGLRLAEEGPAGMPADSWFDFSPYLPPGARPASGSFLCLEPHLRSTPGVASHLIGMGYHWALSRGVTHLLAPFNPEVALRFLKTGARQVAPAFIHQETGLPVLPAIFDLAELDERFLSFARRQQVSHFLSSFERQFNCAGETVVGPGAETWAGVFVVVDGEVAVLPGDEASADEVGLLGRGDVFGDLAVVAGQTPSTEVVAVTDVDLMMVSQDTFFAQLPSGAVSRLLETGGHRLDQLDGLRARTRVEASMSMRIKGRPAVPLGTSSAAV